MDTKKLRQKILDLAIHGKLVPQDPNDEPASVLLERIREKKDRLIKEGKIKKTKSTASSDTSHYENVPFEVPEGWCWCTLDDLAFYKKGPFGSSLTKSMFIPDSTTAYKVYEQKNAIQKDHTLGSYFIDEEKFKELSGFKVEPNDIIVSCAGTIGETYVMPNDIREGIINQALMLIRLHLNDIQNFYLLYFDFILKAEAAKESKGTAIKNIPPFDVLKSFLIPIPPLAEQGRILEEVNKLMSFVDSIDVSAKDISSLINSAKSRILDLAIHGKLVPQDANDESASELLKRINPKAVASCDNPHYGILPENWCWVKLGQLFNIVSAKRVTKDQWKSVGVPFYRTREIVQLSQNGHVDNDLFIDIEHYESLKNKYGIPQPGDIMLTAVGTIGKTYVVSQDDKFYYKDASVLCMRNVHNINSQYIELAFCSSLVQKQLYEKSKGTTVDTITIEKANNYIFPIPPIEEQNRIVAKVNELFSQLDMIKKSLQA